MLACIQKDGTLILRPMCPTEAYAVDQWFRNYNTDSQRPSGLAIDFSMSLVYSPNPTPRND